MVLNGMDESAIAKQYFSTKNVNSTADHGFNEEFSMANFSKEVLNRKENLHGDTTSTLNEATIALDNAYVSEMAGKNIKDFKVRARGNVVPRVAKRITIEE